VRARAAMARRTRGEVGNESASKLGPGDLRAVAPMAPPLQRSAAVRYHVLKAGVTIRNIGVCLALVAGSYLASGLVNASPVTQPEMSGPRSRGVIVTPAPAALERPTPAPDRPALNRSEHLHTL